MSEQILDAKQIKRRFHLLCYFIRVCSNLLDLNNFDGLRGVMAGLQSTPIHRLERTWAVKCLDLDVGFQRERNLFEIK